MRKRKITDKEKEMMNGGIAVEETKEPVVEVRDKFLLTIKDAAAELHRMEELQNARQEMNRTKDEAV